MENQNNLKTSKPIWNYPKTKSLIGDLKISINMERLEKIFELDKFKEIGEKFPELHDSSQRYCIKIIECGGEIKDVVRYLTVDIFNEIIESGKKNKNLNVSK